MILVHPPCQYPDGNIRSHAASDGSLYELDLFARALDLDVGQFVNHRIFPHYILPPELYQRAIALDFPNVRQTSRELLARDGLTRQQIETTRVVNVERESPNLMVDRSSRWGNPFRVSDYGREKAVELFRDRALADRDLLDQLKLLKGRTLGCHCKPLACHADVYSGMIRGVPVPQATLFPAEESNLF